MGFSDEQLRIAREAQRKIGVAQNTKFKGSLIEGLADDMKFKEVTKRLRKHRAPIGTSYTWSVSEEVGTLRLLFYSEDVEDYTRQDGKIDLLMAMWTARELLLHGPVKITKEYARSKGVTYTLQAGNRYQVLRELGKKNCLYVLKRPLTGFAQKSGIVAAPR